ncbi:MAG: hypothetical protein WBQ62_05750, partial [Dehalococcoidales bacterium]
SMVMVPPYTGVFAATVVVVVTVTACVVVVVVYWYRKSTTKTGPLPLPSGNSAPTPPKIVSFSPFSPFYYF